MNEDLLREILGLGAGAFGSLPGGSGGAFGSLPGGSGGAFGNGSGGEKAPAEDMSAEDAIANIVSFGLLSQEQGAEIKRLIGDLAASKDGSSSGVLGGETQKGGDSAREASKKAHEAFKKEHAAIFKSEAGALLEEYLKEAGAGDLEKIGKILRAAEGLARSPEGLAAQAADLAIKKAAGSGSSAAREQLLREQNLSAREQNLSGANEEAKKRLKTYSSQGSRAKHEAKKVYSRDEIARMSAAEFAREHDKIMNDFANGRIL